MNIDDTIIIEKLKDLVRVYGTQHEAAKHIFKPDSQPITETYLSMLINGKQAIPEWLANVFHYRAEWIYYPLMENKD